VADPDLELKGGWGGLLAPLAFLPSAIFLLKTRMGAAP